MNKYHVMITQTRTFEAVVEAATPEAATAAAELLYGDDVANFEEGDASHAIEAAPVVVEIPQLQDVPRYTWNGVAVTERINE